MLTKKVQNNKFSQDLYKELKIKPRFAHYKSFYDNDAAFDSGVLLFFRGPKSYTGEDMVEFQIHGGNAVKQRLLQTMSKMENFREAEPGEFTRRALLNGKLDLLQAEGVNDLINAESE